MLILLPSFEGEFVDDADKFSLSTSFIIRRASCKNNSCVMHNEFYLSSAAMKLRPFILSEQRSAGSLSAVTNMTKYVLTEFHTHESNLA